MRRRPAPPRSRPLVAALACAAVLGAPAGPAVAGGLGSPEQRYVDEDDDKAAEPMLAKLIEKYPTPASCADLVRALRTKRSYPPNMKDGDTLAFLCSDKVSRQFTYVLPRKFAKGKPAGALIFLHGAISQGAPGGGAGEARMFAPAVESLGLITVGPSTFDKVEWGSPACRGLVHHALDFVKRSFNVDENRVFLAGDSDGGRGTYAVAETEATFLGAAVPVIGSPGGVTRFANFRNLPWLAINGEKDTLFTPDLVRPAVEGMKEAGIDITWKLVAGQGHDPRMFLTFKDEVCEFLGKHPRDPLPKTVDWQVDPSRGEEYPGGFPANTFRWIRVEKTGDAKSNAPFDDAKGSINGSLPRVRAKREGNAIDVETSGVTAVTVLLSDAMVDLSKEVEIRVNGRSAFKGKVAPDARAILEEARRFRDRALVFSARVTVDVDAAGADAPPGDGPGGSK